MHHDDVGFNDTWLASERLETGQWAPLAWCYVSRLEVRGGGWTRKTEGVGRKGSERFFGRGKKQVIIITIYFFSSPASSVRSLILSGFRTKDHRKPRGAPRVDPLLLPCHSFFFFSRFPSYKGGHFNAVGLDRVASESKY